MIRSIKINAIAEFDIELSNRMDKDVLDFLLKQYNETLDEGEPPLESLADADPDVLHDVIREALADDIESIIDVGDVTDAHNFDIEVVS